MLPFTTSDPSFHCLPSLSPLRPHRHLNWVVVTYSTRPACCQCPPRIRITLCPPLLSVRLSVLLSVCLLPVSCIFRMMPLSRFVFGGRLLRCSPMHFVCSFIARVEERGNCDVDCEVGSAAHACLRACCASFVFR